MKRINYSAARKRLREVLDECVNDSVPVCIVSKNNQVVMVSKTDYDLMIKKISKDLIK